MVGRTRSRIKWDDGKPKHPGKFTGSVYGVPFTVEIFHDIQHSQRTTWTMDFEIFGEKYSNSGQSGGVQRAVSCLRNDLDIVCNQHNVEMD